MTAAAQMTIDGTGHEPDRELSQWITPPQVAKKMARLVGPEMMLLSGMMPMRILEPSAGSGSLVRALLDEARRDNDLEIDAVEIDHRWAPDLYRTLGSRAPTWRDYLTRPAPSSRYHLAMMNPPFEKGLDGLFLEKAMTESDQVIALIRTHALHGEARFEQVWAHVDDGEWAMKALRLFRGRVRFGTEGPPKHEMCVVQLLRRSAYSGPITTDVRWW